MKNQSTEKIKKITWKLLGELTEDMKKIWGERLLSIFVTGSTAHNDFKLNQDVDLFIIIKDYAEGENLLQLKKDLKAMAIEGKVKSDVEPIVPKEMMASFEKLSKKYEDAETKIIVKFIIGPYFPKPIKKLNIHLHTQAPISLKFFQIFTNLFPFHMLTIVHNCKVLYGKHPSELIKVKATKKYLKIWLNNLKQRLLKAEKMIDKEPQQALLIISKAVLQVSMVALTYVGIYENESKKIIKSIACKFNIPLKKLPAKAYILKKNPENILKDKIKLRDFFREALNYIESLEKYFKKA